MFKALRRSTIYRHDSHPEWGHGVMVEENPEKLYLHFEHGGRRAFLNAPRFRDQLIPMALSAAETAALLGELERHLPRPSKPARRRNRVESVVAPAKGRRREGG